MPIIFYLLEHVKVTKLSKVNWKLTDWKRFQYIASELISPRLEINTGIEAEKQPETLQPLLLRRIGCRQERLHFLTLTPIFLV
jgi:hypothetical protein